MAGALGIRLRARNGRGLLTAHRGHALLHRDAQGRHDGPAAGAAGVVYVGSRPNNLLYRHNVSVGMRNTRPMMVMERDGALRAQRLLRAGKTLTLTADIDIQSGPAYESYNVRAEGRLRHGLRDPLTFSSADRTVTAHSQRSRDCTTRGAC